MSDKLKWWEYVTMPLSVFGMLVALWGVVLYVVSCVMAVTGSCGVFMPTAEWSFYLTFGGLAFGGMMAGSESAAGIILMCPIVVVPFGAVLAVMAMVGGCV